MAVALNPEVQTKVNSHARAIRYQARRDNVPLPKALNDYVSKNNLSGTERTALRSKLGLTEARSDWRSDLREVIDIPSSEPKKDKDSEKKINPKNVNNKIVINPPMQEAFEEIGGTIMEVVELGEADMADANRKQQIQRKQVMLDRQKLQLKQKSLQKKQPTASADTITSEGVEVKKKLNVKTADMGDVVKDFYKSDAPQFKGKSKEKRREMAIAAKLQAEKPQ